MLCTILVQNESYVLILTVFFQGEQIGFKLTWEMLHFYLG